MAAIAQLYAVVREPLEPNASDDELWEDHLKVRELVQRLRRKQGTGIARDAAGTSDFTTLEAWLRAEGAIIQKVEVGVSGAGMGNGLFATETTEVGETLLQIPSKCMLSEVTAASCSKIGSFVTSDPMLSAMPNLALAVHLLAELNDPASPYRAYIATLPSSFPLPMTWSERDIARLRGLPLFARVLRLYRNVARQYCYLYTRIVEGALRPAKQDTQTTAAKNKKKNNGKKGGKKGTKNASSTSVEATSSNSVEATGSNSTSGAALTPSSFVYDDFVWAQSTEFSVENDALVFKAPESCSKGAQVCMNYGQRSNEDLLLFQGFVDGDHPADTATLIFDVDADVEARPVRLMLLKNLGIQVPGPFHVDAFPHPLDPQLLAALRVAAMGKDELTARLRDPASCADLGEEKDGVVSADCARTANALLAAALARASAAGPSGDEDKQEGKEQDDSSGEAEATASPKALVRLG
ncbi:hypothetical protein PTSG_09157 [Salpingoeca rosetta]|uniref:protein-histidine N-methyltransferase n=1 Tax=Salpingoeca rosetta (strain ATCC 50818 / BSB-021) TaxID=946362 RepID=F2UMW3_SALR5|nr:uncharacterized protein PTSG_09157 [Salpingoeca rosetta]EGD78462.1 hypothetical protein PTSG_09157 [Salpingoeca rosetta]|eukprot:XP_004989411.1 hypothetical protein PTSG_09157 [Salpingoeca rosetta]